ncbi:YcjX family protein [Pseudogemmobacter faecipullorum]|uniref:YcjX family protein n=1 Tax=Pseudogemmobacter faecipullorum TaxID=2755041 RepID=A0ABS8CP03_9RHOB|nr:YcjX family protein [Pseudogemmobacter faecipullorum]MCB5411086.1 YcjX family protein [Pseudogemmobacter faecipullorum]
MAFSGITDGIARGADSLQSGVSGLFFEQNLRLGVTGLSRAGKTVFITALIASLLNRGRMLQLSAAREGRIAAVHLQPQPDMTLPRFDYENHIAALTDEDPHWPGSTRSISELRLSFRTRPSGWFAGMRGPQVLHLDIVDYPGEWLLDLALMEKDYATWSEDTLSLIAKRAPVLPEARDFLAIARAEDGALPLEELRIQRLSTAFTRYLQAARAAGWSDCTPGRFLLPGDLAGSPVLTFAPLPEPASAPRGSLGREAAKRYEAYKDRVVTPFFRDHFSRIDRQIVLMDVLGAIHNGPPAVEDLRKVMAEVLTAFRVGRGSWIGRLLGGRRVEKILFAATRADHLHHEQHPALTAITEALVAEARQRSEFAGAGVGALSLASLRATVEERVERDGQSLPAVRGRLLGSGRQVVVYPGALPPDPARILAPARSGAGAWLEDFGLMEFAPARFSLRPGEGPPHIRLDRAAEFLIGDRL